MQSRLRGAAMGSSYRRQLGECIPPRKSFKVSTCKPLSVDR